MCKLPDNYFDKKNPGGEKYIFNRLKQFSRDQFHTAGYKSPFEFNTFKEFNLYMLRQIRANKDTELFKDLGCSMRKMIYNKSKAK